MIDWLDRDGKLLLASRSLRSLGYGFLSVTLAVYLGTIGFNGKEIGALIAFSIGGGAVLSILAGFFADRWGRRKLLIAFSLLMSLSGIVFFLTQNLILLILVSLFGMTSATGAEAPHVLSIEQAIIPQTCDARKRNNAFAVYNTFGTLAMSVGVLLAGAPRLLAGFGFNELYSIKLLFLLYSVLGALSALLYVIMSPKAEPSSVQESVLSGSRRIVGKLSLLFALDSFAGGFVVQSILSYWFFARFGIDLVGISRIFFVSGVITALSYMAAAKIADRAGLVKTMVFTHIPANIFLMLLPFSPNLSVAALLLFLRMSLSQMDVPTRQSYIAAVVKPEERVAAAAFTTTARSVGQAISPIFAGFALGPFYYPLLIAGGLKIIYDIALYTSFRRLKAPEEKA